MRRGLLLVVLLVLGLPSVAQAALPALSLATPTDVTNTSATMTAELTANGAETFFRVEWGTTTAYGNGSGQEGSRLGDFDGVVGIPVTTLTPGTTYHYRFIARHAGEDAVAGPDQTFTTSAPVPLATTTDATSVASTTATLNGTADTGGAPGTARFEYAPEGGTPVVTAEQALAGTAVAAPVAGLPQGTLVSYRLVVTTLGGTSAGETRTFRTAVPSPVPPAPTPTPTPAPSPMPTPTPEPVARVVKPKAVTLGKLLASAKAVKVAVGCGTVVCSAKARAEVRVGKKRLGAFAAPRKALRIPARGTGRISLVSSQALRAKVKRYLKARRKAKPVIVITTTITPAGGKAVTRTVRVTVPRPK